MADDVGDARVGHGRIHVAGADGIDVDVVAAPFRGQGAHEVHVGALAGVVGDGLHVGRVAGDAGDRREVDDAALAAAIELPRDHWRAFIAIALGLYETFRRTDSTLAEINPLVLTPEGKLLALDGKIVVDDNALFRHPEIADLRDLDEEAPSEREARKYGLSYVKLEGTIGCMVNGAGLAMATMDIIKLYGGSPANFLDVGGGATTEKVTEAFKLMLKNPHLKAILVNIFGGIMKCDVIAEGVVAAARQVHLTVPLVVRLEGTNVELGKQILAESGLPIISGNDMADAAQKVVAAAREAKK